MDRCDLCSMDGRGGLELVSGLRLCLECVHEDPTRALKTRGIVPLEGDLSFSTSPGFHFHASMFLDRHDLGFSLRCHREGLHHKVIELFSSGFEVGDPVFDDAVHLRTSDPDRARALLDNQGAQSALLALLTHAPANDARGNAVVLDRRRIVVDLNKVGDLDEDGLQRLRLETAALAMHAIAVARPVQ